MSNRTSSNEYTEPTPGTPVLNEHRSTADDKEDTNKTQSRCDFAREIRKGEYASLYARGVLTCNVPGLVKTETGELVTPTLRVDEQGNLQNFFNEDNQPLPLYDFSGDGEEKVLVQPTMVGITKEMPILIWVQENNEDHFFALEAWGTQAKKMNMYFKKGDSICVLAYKNFRKSAITGEKEVVWCVEDIFKTQNNLICEKKADKATLIAPIPEPARCEFARILMSAEDEFLHARGILTCNVPGLAKTELGKLVTPTLRVDEQGNLQNFFDEDNQPLPLYDYSGDGEEKVLVQPAMVGNTKEKKILIWVQENNKNNFFALEAWDTQAKKMNMFFKKGDSICVFAQKKVCKNATTGEKEVIWCVEDISKTQKDYICIRYDEGGYVNDIDINNITDRFLAEKAKEDQRILARIAKEEQRIAAEKERKLHLLMAQAKTARGSNKLYLQSQIQELEGNEYFAAIIKRQADTQRRIEEQRKKEFERKMEDQRIQAEYKERLNMWLIDKRLSSDSPNEIKKKEKEGGYVSDIDTKNATDRFNRRR